MSSLYAKYLTERTEDCILETDIGFATYRFINDKTVFVINLFVLAEFRRTHVATSLGDQIVSIAKSKGCDTLQGSVVPSAKGSTEGLKAFLRYGMKIKSSVEDFIILEKKI